MMKIKDYLTDDEALKIYEAIKHKPKRHQEDKPVKTQYQKKHKGVKSWQS